MDALAALYQQFDPLRPLEADETDLYVDWQKETGADDIKKRLASAISLSGDTPETRLFTGHRGVGKTTELKRVKYRLENGSPKLFVSLLLAAEFVDLSDVQPPDLILQIARQIVDDLKKAGFGFGWEKMRQFFGELNEILRSDVDLKDLKIGGDPVELGVAIKSVPGARYRLRKLLEDRLPSVYDLINREILAQAREWLAKEENGGFKDVVIIVDQLDRIPQKIVNPQGLTNHISLFLDNAGTLRALDCDVLFTIPIELAYSRARTRLEDVYGCKIFTLPVIAVTERGRSDFESGLDALRRIVERRAARAGVTGGVFESSDWLTRFCRLSGGHVRSLFILLRSALERAESLPVPDAIAERSILLAAADLVVPLRARDWEILREVHKTNAPPTDPAHADLFHEMLRDLLIFAYRDDKGIWYDWNPLLELTGGV